MPHGWPDYFMTLPKENIYGTTDVLELLARLKMLSPGLRRGNIFWIDFFEIVGGTWNYSFLYHTPQLYRTITNPAFGVTHPYFKWSYPGIGWVKFETETLMPPATTVAIECYFISDTYLNSFTIGYYLKGEEYTYYYEFNVNISLDAFKWRKSKDEYIIEQKYLQAHLFTEHPRYIRLGFDISKNKYTYVMLNSNIHIAPDFEVIPERRNDYNVATFTFTYVSTAYMPGFTPLCAAIYIND